MGSGGQVSEKWGTWGTLILGMFMYVIFVILYGFVSTQYPSALPRQSPPWHFVAQSRGNNSSSSCRTMTLRILSRTWRIWQAAGPCSRCDCECVSTKARSVYVVLFKIGAVRAGLGSASFLHQKNMPKACEESWPWQLRVLARFALLSTMHTIAHHYTPLHAIAHHCTPLHTDSLC